MNLLAWPLTALMSAAISPPPPLPQGGCNLIEVWVDPIHGTDPAPGGQGPGHQVVRINNPGAPTKTVQAAIDLAGEYLRDNYSLTENRDQEAVIHLLPGIYGPATAFNGNVGNGETYPIRMHDRVHLRGVNARRCVIRGVSDLDPVTYNANLSEVYWPENAPCNVLGQIQKQVLLDCTYSGFFRRVPPNNAELLPWASDPLYYQTTESIDSLTFQGGDVQVLYGYSKELPVPLRGRVTNCLFDMRDNILVEEGVVLSGPSMGLAVQQTWVDEINPVSSDLEIAGGGYAPQEVASIGNTFLMAEFVKTATGGLWLRCRPGAVGILDTCDPLCGAQVADPIQDPRGVNRLGVQNTLLRTYTGGAPTNGAEMAMVGVSSDDALVDVGGQWSDTNAFAIARAGSASIHPTSTNQSFDSPPYAPGSFGGTLGYQFLPGVTWTLFLFDQTASAPQTPKVKAWDGDGTLAPPQFDPAFVGEYLRTVSPVLSSYRDWRILPGSPLQNQGFGGAVSTFQNGSVHTDSACGLLETLQWDHEQFGNLRVVDGAPDIGFDETQLGVMAGSYANHSYSHNRKGVLNDVVADEQDTRFVFLRRTVPGGFDPLAGRTLRLLSHEIVAGTSFRAWTNPPGSLTAPLPQAGSPAGYDLRFTEIVAGAAVPPLDGLQIQVPGPLEEWPNWQMAPGQPAIDLTLVQLPADDEGAGFASWVTIQPIVTATDQPTVFGNMQPEFR